MICAIPITNSKVNAVKTSRRLVFATSRNSGRVKYADDNHRCDGAKRLRRIDPARLTGTAYQRRHA